MTHTIRPAKAGDRDALLRIAEASGLFGPDELEYMACALADWAMGETPHRWLIEDGDTPGGAAMLAAEEMSDSVWNMLFLGVAPERRRNGLARALISACEDAVRADGGRMMLIDTAGVDEQAAARATYGAAGYAQVAVIPDYYGDGVDRVTFCKRL